MRLLPPRPRTAGLLTAVVVAAAVSATAAPAAYARTAIAPRLLISATPSVFYAGQSSNVVVQGQPGVTILLYAFSAPSKDYREVRRATMPADGTLELSVKPSTDSSVFAAVRGETGNESIARELHVRTASTVAASRTGTRTYVFSGRLLPGAQTIPVSLYRLASDGSEVLTARATSDGSTGTYRMTRTFSGTGTFSFVVRTSQSSTNAAGVSPVLRLTVS
ncbi:MAG: hypothetical protein JWM64_1350 [Frankiales bacterium]|nr:hypothetical protein [Frankiales bacterium]